ncbi:hypothetical protein CKALI_08145 [Corynebacterium kalinowskii]|uniref:Uncharacterized protein n=1 Tax=Corynebacterium kalinowskii TaxID=2675216 RepID=A0A6B8VHK5_9CORY|nr:hypothetical protein [Corynebacterium kalinowskii]QGU02489.1 hypothetical protein CKALI_08145 [Corynebacterium kalinowskii]
MLDNTPKKATEPYIRNLNHAPLPTESTLKRRKSIPFQLVRFAVSNLRLALMVFGGKH